MNEIKKKIKIEDNIFSPQNPLIIAELGTAHGGDIVKAKEMSNAAKQAGANCIKFQMVFADEILHPNTGEVSLPGGKIRLYDHFKMLEMPVDFYAEIKEYVESLGILFLCTPFGLKSASILREIRPKCVKIASPELNFSSLLEEIAVWNIPVLLSSGVSKLKDIENALEIIIENNDISPLPAVQSLLPIPYPLLPDICLLHCVTSYPAPETDYNLKVLPNLAGIFGVSVGVSDHSSDPELVPALAVSMGASVIEKHFCLSKSDPGLDDPIALPPDDFSKMTAAIRFAAEAGLEKTVECYSSERGEKFIGQILGNGIKTLAPSEKANYRYTNRSIHAMYDIYPGEELDKSNYAVLRTEKNLRPGLEPYWEKILEGKKARQFIPSGEGIRFEDIC